jgi:hypothetical protein
MHHVHWQPNVTLPFFNTFSSQIQLHSAQRDQPHNKKVSRQFFPYQWRVLWALTRDHYERSDGKVGDRAFCLVFGVALPAR